MSNELELEKYKVINWLHETESPLYWGWSINQHVEDVNLHALILRVPPYYIVNRKKYRTSLVQQFANGMNFPVQHISKTVNFNFRTLDCLEWDTLEVDPLVQDKGNILNVLKQSPYFFYWIDMLLSNEAPLDKIQAECKGVVTVMDWDTHEESLVTKE